MQVVAFDTETALIRPALLAPPLVCVTSQRSGEGAQICHVTAAEKRIEVWLSGSENILVGHNTAYDMAVICERFPILRPRIFEAYAQDRVTDTMIRQQLLDIAAGCYRGRVGEKGKWFSYEYTLEALAKRCAGMQLLKDGWRLSYAEFLDTPLEEWPRRAREVQAAARPRVVELTARIEDVDAAGKPREDEETIKALVKERAGLEEMIAGDPMRCAEYPLDDARATLAVYQAQEKHVAYLADQYRQARAAFALHLSSAWGLRTDAVGVELLRSTTQAQYDELEDELIQLGLIRNDKKKTRDTKAAKARMIRVCAEEKIPLRRTDAHADPECTKCRDGEGNPLPAGDDRLRRARLPRRGRLQRHRRRRARGVHRSERLQEGALERRPGAAEGRQVPRAHAVRLAETGRTTSSKPNIQNLRRMAGVREAFVPRPGKVFFAADYPAARIVLPRAVLRLHGSASRRWPST
jgi:hypothetical protein